MMEKNSKIFVAGHRGLVGSAITRHLKKDGFSNILTTTREQVDLRDQAAVNYWFQASKPDYVFLVAGTVGGIMANSTRPAEFLYDNMMIHATVVHAAHLHNIKKLLYLGSSCIYPRECTQPMKEEYLLTGKLEPTNEAYAIAKIAGIKLCQSYRKQYGSNFISGMPTNLYGPNDNFDLNDSHVLPALLRRFYEAQLTKSETVTLWGTGSPRREFLHVDDLAEACLFLMREYEGAEHVNIGTGTDLTIRELAERIQQLAAPDTKLEWDRSKPDGMPQKLLDISRIKELGWTPRIPLQEGLKATFDWFQKNYTEVIQPRASKKEPV